MLTGTFDIIDNSNISGIWNQKLPSVTMAFQENLEKIKRCSMDGKLHTSEVLLSEEMDNDHLSENAHPTDSQRCVYNKRQVNQFRQIVLNSFSNPTIIPDAEVKELMSIIREYDVYTEDHDISLIITALKVSQPDMVTILVSHDLRFEQPINILIDLGTIRIGGISYNTHQLIWYTYLFFLTNSHKCCNYENDEYASLYNAWNFSSLRRLEKNENRRFMRSILEENRKAQKIMQIAMQDKNQSG